MAHAPPDYNNNHDDPNNNGKIALLRCFKFVSKTHVLTFLDAINNSLIERVRAANAIDDNLTHDCRKKLSHLFARHNSDGEQAVSVMICSLLKGM